MINKVILLGRLGSDPQIRHLDGNRSVCNVNLATNEHFKTADGSTRETTEWHRLEMWDSLARLAEKSLKKGAIVYVEGKIRTDKYTDNQGIEKETKKIRVTTLQIIGARERGESDDHSSGNTSAGNTVLNDPKEIDNLLSDAGEDLPF